MNAQSLFELSDQAIDSASLRSRLLANDAGAFVCFEGWVRNHHQGQAVRGLTYSAHVALALLQGQDVMKKALQQFAGIRCLAVHRLGALELGDIAVWVGVCSAHRDQAFSACRMIIDTIKLDVPIWKHEHYLQGESTWLHPLT